MKMIKHTPNILSYLAIALISCFIAACSPDDQDKELGPAPSSDMVAFSATPTTGNANIITFKNETPGAFKAIWDFGNGATAEGEQVESSFAVEGDYTVKLTVFTNGGYASSTKTIRIDKTDFSMLNREDYNFLTGGTDKPNGKTWVFDPVGPMNFGGPPTAPSSWWSQTLAEQNDCMKDDKYTFKLKDFAFENKSGGEMWGVLDGQENVCVPQTAKPSTWTIYQEKGKTMLSVSNGETIAWDDNEGVYELVELSENKLHIRKVCCGGSGVRNYVLVPEGFSPPVQEKPYKIIDINDNFDVDGNITWKKENLTLNESYDNPAPVPINTSAKVAMYVKQEGQAYEFANMFTDFSHKLDLRERHVFRLKVFIPSYNDFTTANGESWADPRLLKQVSVKLQDGTAAQPWANQVEIKQQVSQLDKWVELTFDFGAADVRSRKDLDRLVIQIGGEGNFIPGIFFLDDFELLK
ncbi:PKD domain-containing protein [Pontibacter oryzae]|uniref:PKD domain-containing protein n=1 Tax=Pontibacter oryzae TaxID=2304593 RepID=A0A399SF93_9BACT|nr:PKD domain-containing protein [Pontibacter oryzae]RIJ42796.1 hypothetical protein D1627_02815 [Pontibacter oryzae]